MQVIKRDGSTVDFDRAKIVIAINKANDAVEPYERISYDQIESVVQYIEQKRRKRLLVEDIQMYIADFYRYDLEIIKVKNRYFLKKCVFK